MATPSKRTVDARIKPLGLTIEHERGSGYFYFRDLVTGNQVGESVFVCYWHHLTLDQWEMQAAATRQLATQQN